MEVLSHGVGVVLGCVVLLLHCHCAPAQPPSSPFVDFLHFDDSDPIYMAYPSANHPGYSTELFSMQCFNPVSDDLGLPLPDNTIPYFNRSHLAPNNVTVSCLDPTPVRFKDNATSNSVFSFSSKFVIGLGLGSYSNDAVQEGYNDFVIRNGLQGFTFALLPDYNQSGAGRGGYLGLLNESSNGNNNSHTVAVEFDFVQNPEFADPNGGFHLGLDINSMNSSAWSYFDGVPAANGVGTLQVWIEYDGSSQTLNVTTLDISDRSCPVSDAKRPTEPVTPDDNTSEVRNSLSRKVDLSSVLNEQMYVGFTSSFATDYTNVDWDIQSWSFRTSSSASPPTPSLALPCQKYYKDPFRKRLFSILAGLFASSVVYAVVYAFYSRRAERRGWRFNVDAGELGAGDPHEFTYRELALATDNFDPKRALGRGGFGSVYKGFLPGNRQDVAVKRVSPESKQGEREFMAEVVIIGKLRHRNLVRLQGWCHEKGELLLVYDYMPQGSLDKLLFANRPITWPEAFPDQGLELQPLDTNAVVRFPWEKRFKVIVDVATALVYLHTECEERIIHRDVKAANVMLDAKFNARLGDFGLARSYNHSLLHPESTNVAGTLGYLAPELFYTGKQTEQTDVYSFGAFLLEVACGRKPFCYEEGDVLVDRVWKRWGDSQILDSADPQLAGMYDEGEMTKVLCLGLLCSHPSPILRPSMRRVLLILNGEVSLPHVPPSKPRTGEEIQRTLSQDLGSWSTTSSHSSSSARAAVSGTAT